MTLPIADVLAAARTGRPHERMTWLLRRMTDGHRSGFIVAWDTDTVDAFVRDFPEAGRSLRVYTMGPNSSPMLNAAAKRAKDAGYITAGSIGTEDARSYNQRTWARTWRLTAAGSAALETERDRRSHAAAIATLPEDRR